MGNLPQNWVVATHRKTGTKEYRTWTRMKERCFNENFIGFHDYGGRGISVCERWLKFENFFEDMGNSPSTKHSLDRIDNDGNYEPGNCRWATNLQQKANTRRTIHITMDGETHCQSEWARLLGMSSAMLSRRMRNGERRLSVIFSKKPLPRGRHAGRLTR